MVKTYIYKVIDLIKKAKELEGRKEKRRLNPYLFNILFASTHIYIYLYALD